MAHGQPAVADQELAARYGPLLLQCYENAPDGQAQIQCIGSLSGACIDQEDGGETTFGIASCNNAETLIWDGLLNDEYQKSMAWAKEGDAEDQTDFPEFANRANALRDAQRAWIPFRDANCNLDYAAWGAGSMRHIAGTSCLLQMTAERTIDLRFIRDFMQ